MYNISDPPPSRPGLPPGHPLIGAPCRACGDPFREDSHVAMVRILANSMEPGSDIEVARAAREGRPVGWEPLHLWCAEIDTLCGMHEVRLNLKKRIDNATSKLRGERDEARATLARVREVLARADSWRLRREDIEAALGGYLAEEVK